MDIQQVVQIALSAITLGAIYCLFALGLTLIFGIMHIIQFAHGEVYMFGAFAGYYLINIIGINLGFSLLIVMLVIALFGMAIQKLFFSPLIGKPVATLAMSFGLLLALQGAALAIFGGKEKMIQTPLNNIVRFPGGVTTTYHNAFIVGVTGVLVVGLYYFIYKTKYGRAMRAIEQDMDTAALMGIAASHINLLAFAIGCGLAGIAGLLVGAVFPVEPIMGGGILLKAFAIIIVGGIGSLFGAIVASFIWSFAELFAGFAIGGDLAFVVCYAAVFLILVFKPTGLFGHAVQ